MNVKLRAVLVVFAIVVLACSCSPAPEDEAGEIGVAISALSVCEEVVPSNRSVDGIPAYKQCSASESSAIYSNDGVNTATTKMGPDWIETQYDNGYQCTELVQRYLHFRWQIDWLPDDDAGYWCDSQPPANSGLVLTMKPVHGDIMVLAPGSCGSSDDGHAGCRQRFTLSHHAASDEDPARNDDAARQPAAGRAAASHSGAARRPAAHGWIAGSAHATDASVG